MRYQSFKEFWPFYLSQHQNRTCRVLHYIGTTLGISALVYCIVTDQPWWAVFLCFIPAYTLAWIGHFVFEKNRPATFTYPRWSFLADFKMLFCFLTGKLGRDLGQDSKK